MLDHLYHQSISNPLTPTIPSKPGPPLQTTSNAVVIPAKEIVCNINLFVYLKCIIILISFLVTWDYRRCTTCTMWDSSFLDLYLDDRQRASRWISCFCCTFVRNLSQPCQCAWITLAVLWKKQKSCCCSKDLGFFGYQSRVCIYIACNIYNLLIKILKFIYFFYRAEISLSKRVEYLARAVVCMRSDQTGYAPYLGIFLRELEDKLEVARMQQQVHILSC